MSRLLFHIFIFTLLSLPLMAQEKLSAKKHIKLADQLVLENKYALAGQHYEDAWSLKPKKLEYLHSAAQAYLKGREYRKAAESFGTLKDNKFFPQARLQYAISLQQSGQYDEAIPEFLLYLNGYNGKDRDLVQERIEGYINGCSMAIRQADSTESKKIKLEHLTERINSPESETSPIPFGDDILYFTQSSDVGNKFLRSQLANSEWAAAQNVANLPLLGNATFENGAFSTDGNRFYCTQCQYITLKKEKKKTCALYVLKRSDKGWSSPIKLPERVNTEGGITTQPYVFNKDGKEIILFVSNRVGGKGGMDIWNTTRDLSGDSYTEPQNMGSEVNTQEDEATPYYDIEENMLYFSSAGKAGFGGLDIFKSKGGNNKWEEAENIGAPFNSGADDYYFIKNKSLSGGFFVSNRSIGMEKISSRDEDIFYFKLNNKIELNIVGKVFEKESKNLLENARVSLYEKRNKDIKRLLSSIMSPDGKYDFSLMPQKIYQLEVEKDGYQLTHYSFNTKDSLKSMYHDFILEKYVLLASNKVEIQKKDIDKKANENKPPTNKNDKDSKKETDKIASKNPPKPKNTEGEVSYKVQVLSYEYLDNTYRKRLSRVDDLGEFDTEKTTINGKTYTRVMLASYDSFEKANAILKKVKDRSLTDAFIIRYENGKRTNKSK